MAFRARRRRSDMEASTAGTPGSRATHASRVVADWRGTFPHLRGSGDLATRSTAGDGRQFSRALDRRDAEGDGDGRPQRAKGLPTSLRSSGISRAARAFGRFRVWTLRAGVDPMGGQEALAIGGREGRKITPRSPMSTLASGYAAVASPRQSTKWRRNPRIRSKLAPNWA